RSDQAGMPRPASTTMLGAVLRRFASIPARLSLLVLLAAPGPFRGCQSESGGGPIPLPRDPSDACFFDEECVPAGCEEVRCIAGRCTETAPIRDGDRDGHAPMPCGGDCDDADRTIHPGRGEACDRVDQDCDTRIDEDATPAALTFRLNTVDPTMTMV